MNYREIIHKLNKMNLLHRIYIGRAFHHHGLYFGQLAILEYIIKNENCTQRELAEALGVSAPSIATSIKRMSRGELIEKNDDDKDSRVNRLKVTSSGREIAEKCRKDFDKVDEKMFQGFTPEECDILSGYLERLMINLSQGEFEDKNFFSLVEEEKLLREKKKKGGHI
ncbi:MarR family winged helix-turn-helix transcriptional regulator [Alloiococcus sp. CFN-8]|uniref:MarR family winged helix-turn-helix transcriptional regulator n=1 Tax=Alloiococcus sp. CFN-8 TaxID=3416081 RepID=UPI003CEB8327